MTICTLPAGAQRNCIPISVFVSGAQFARCGDTRAALLNERKRCIHSRGGLVLNFSKQQPTSIFLSLSLSHRSSLHNSTNHSSSQAVILASSLSLRSLSQRNSSSRTGKLFELLQHNTVFLSTGLPESKTPDLPLHRRCMHPAHTPRVCTRPVESAL